MAGAKRPTAPGAGRPAVRRPRPAGPPHGGGRGRRVVRHPPVSALRPDSAPPCRVEFLRLLGNRCNCLVFCCDARNMKTARPAPDLIQFLVRFQWLWLVAEEALEPPTHGL